MTDEEIYQQIEEHSKEADALYSKIHEQVESSIVSHAQKKKRRKKFFTGVLSVAVVLVITLAIVLPITMQSQDEQSRYADVDTLISVPLDCNLKEYCAVNNQSFLYLDWYENAEDLYTARYYEKGKENLTVFLYEEFVDGNTNYNIKLSVMKRNIVIDSLETKAEQYQFTNIDDVHISYALTRQSAFAKFEYHGYKYYLEINDGVTLEFLVKTIESMFNN